MRFFFLSFSGCRAAQGKVTPPQPVTKYWMTMLIMFETTQYNARPLGNWRVIKANSSGMVHSIIRLCACCAGSADGGVTIFCCNHIEPPTSMGRMRYWSGTARFSQRKVLLRGSVEYTTGQE